ncbi:segregation/condensation protein A [Patescibacteria group bacterium]|nr:segregation/condensation protein A [Patescibacteria group bacterium]MBU1029465.1 segregation/condensation protein A [Patescibacteria group bacterium]MBU1916194.1 segregation/condensation protein A [Patescibacteria group bacterium]
MSYTVKLEQFEGPLNLLLQLIEAEKLDISEVSLSQVTDDYLTLLEANPDIPPEELADFLVIASRLLLIKSKLLLPYLQLNTEEDDGLDLESQLRIYKSYLEASKILEKMVGRRRFLYVHDKLPKTEIGFSPPHNLTLDQMRELFLGIIKRLEPLVQPKREALERTVSIHDKITQIRDLISRTKQIKFSALMNSATTRMEIIISFLALLELVKQRNVYVTQSGRFSDITIVKSPKLNKSS